MGKYLLLYYTRYQTTLETAEKIKNRLGKDCRIAPISEGSKIIDDYSNIIIGTPVIMGSIPKSVQKFCHQGHENLMNKNVFLYIHGLIWKNEYKNKINDFFNKELISHFNRIEYLGGKLDYNKMNFMKAFLFKKMSSSLGIDPDNPNNLETDRIEMFIKELEKGL